MGKLSTPEWVLKGYKSKEDWEKKEKKSESKKKFKVRACPECSSKKVSVVLGEEEGKRRGEWECKKCKWKGKHINFEEVSEEEFLKLSEEE